MSEHEHGSECDGECGSEQDAPDCTQAEHAWSSEGEGGCRESPGVWSLGGTTISIRTDCRHCGVIRRDVYRGSQRDNDECDEVTYTRAEA